MKKEFKYNYNRVATTVSSFVGKPQTFIITVLVVVTWIILEPVYDFDDAYQILNTSTTMITFLMVFLIQNTLNRDTHALQLKLDELIRVTKGARNLTEINKDVKEDILETVGEQKSEIADSDS